MQPFFQNSKPKLSAAQFFSDPSEFRACLLLTGSVLLALMIAKSIQNIPYLGATCLVMAAFWQLHVPIWRAERQGLSLHVFGLHLQHWRSEICCAAMLAAVILPLHALCYHWVATSMHAWFPSWRLPVLEFDPKHIFNASMHVQIFAALQACITQLLGVALAEELFYRGYLLPFIEHHLQSRGGKRRAILWVSGLFALAHFLGDWHLSRLGPFFPSLLFCWQRNRHASILGCTLLHAACNLFAGLWAQMYHF